jgi:uncharacterized membrane protein
MQGLSDWLQEISDSLAATEISRWMAEQDWWIAFWQSIHIVVFAVVFGAVLMVTLKVLGLAGRGQTMRQTSRRFGPWVWGGLVILLISGSLLTIAEPEREIMTNAFRIKLVLILVAVIISAWFQISIARRADAWDNDISRRASIRILSVGVLLLWIVILFFGRFIAFDRNLFGCTSPFRSDQYGSCDEVLGTASAPATAGIAVAFAGEER